MAEYKTYAKRGDFNARLSKATNNADKIQQEAARQIKGMNAARSLAAEQEQVYLRAMKFAHSSEKESRETNYKLETENRRMLAEAQQKDLKIDIEIAEAERDRQPEQTLMQELAPLVPKFAEMMGQLGEQRAKQNRDAATVAAYQHGFTLDTLENILKLNDQLTLSQFQATEYIQGLSSQGWSEDNINALYQKQYLTRGSKAWVDNKALAMNSIGNYETGLATHVANMQELSPAEQIAEVRNYTQDWLTRVNINGRPLSAEVMGTVIAPKVRSAETRFLKSIQKDQIERRDEELTSDRYKAYLVTFKDGGGEAFYREMSRNPSFEKRGEMLQFAISAHKSGALTDDELRNIASTTFVHNNKKGKIGEHFIDDNTVAFNTYVRDQQTNELKRMRDRKRDNETLAKSTVLEELNNGTAEGIPWDDDRYEALMDIGRGIAGPDFVSPELEALKEQLPAAILERESYEVLEKMIDAGQGEAAIKLFGAPSSIVNQSVEGMPSLLERARLNDSARANPLFKDHVDILGKHIGQHPTIENSSVSTDRSDFEYEKLYREKQYKNEFFRLLKQSGGDVEESANQALAVVKRDIDEYLKDIKGRNAKLPRLENEAKKYLSDEAKLLQYRTDLRRTRTKKQGVATLAYVLTPKLVMEATQEMQKPGGQVPPKFRLAAETFNMTPMQLQQYVAPEIDGVEPIDTNDSTYQAMVDSMPPQKLALITNPYGSPARLQRALTNRYKLADAPVRTAIRLQGYDATPTEAIRNTGNQYMSYMTVELQLPRNHALGLLANMFRESTFNASVASGDDGGAGGLFQWYAERQTDFVQRIVRSGDWKAQIKYALEEPNEPGQEYLQQEFATPQEAADWWMKYWERPADPERDSGKHTEFFRHWN